ncbi:hypothetical protein Tco_0023608, partial [Tanacetum coccineum]
FGMEIPYTIINDAIKQLVRYKYYMIKKGQSEEDNDEEESEEQVVSRAGRGRGKGYMCSGNQEVNVSSKPKKDVVPRKQRTITYADNILKTKDRVVLLAKSVSTEKQRRSKESRLESIRQEIQARKREGSSAAKDGEFEDFSDINSDVTARSSWSNTYKDDDTDDAENSDMDISDDDSDKGDDNAAGFGVFMYDKSKELPKFTPIM